MNLMRRRRRRHFHSRRPVSRLYYRAYYRVYRRFFYRTIFRTIIGLFKRVFKLIFKREVGKKDQKKGQKKGQKRMHAVVLIVSMVLSLCAGTGVMSEGPVAKAEGRSLFTDNHNNIWEFLPYNNSDSSVYEARNVTLYYHQFTSIETDPITIEIPDKLKKNNDSSNTEYTVTSIGNSAASNGDSFFATDSIGYAPEGVDITFDASNCTGLKTVNANVLKGRSDTTLKLPRSIQSVGAGVLGKTTTTGSGTGEATTVGTNNAIECDALNATYSNRSDVDNTTFLFKGCKNSTAHDTFGDLPHPDGGTRGFVESSTGSVGFKITNESLNGDTDDPARFIGTVTLPYKKYFYTNVTNESEVVVDSINHLDAAVRPTRGTNPVYNAFKGYYAKKSDNTEVKVFDADSSLSYQGWSDTTVDEVILQAQWDPKTVTLSFNGNGNTNSVTMASLTPTYGEKVEIEDPDHAGQKLYQLPANIFEKTGYTFDKWCTTQSGTSGDFYTDKQTNVVFKKNTTLYAQWKVNSYSLKFEANYPTNASYKGGSMTPSPLAHNPETYLYTDKNNGTPSCGFTAGGYTFKEWNTMADGTGTKITTIGDAIAVIEQKNTSTSTSTPTGTSTNPLPIYAIWTADKYKVYYNDRGSNMSQYPNGIEYTCNTAPSPIPTPATAYTGHTFKGWAEASTGSIDYPVGTTITRDLAAPNETKTLYARYASNSYTVKFNKLDAQDIYLNDPTKTEPVTATCYYGVSYEADCYYKRAGCKLVGWTETTNVQPLNSSATQDVIDQYVFKNLKAPFPRTYMDLSATDGDTVNLYPIWQKEKYNVTYHNHNYSGVTIKSGGYTYSYEMGNTVTLPTLERPGHTFKYWTDSSGKQVSKITNEDYGNKDFYAVWDDDKALRIEGSSIRQITATCNGVSKTLVSNGICSADTFKVGNTLSNIRIKAYDYMIITEVEFKNASTGTTIYKPSPLSSGTEVTVPGSVRFPDADIIVSVKIKPTTFKITYETGGGTILGTAPSTYEYGTETKLPTTVTKTDGSKFYGWKNAAGLMVTSISKTQSGDVTLTAVWEDPNIVGLPDGTLATPSANGKFLTITYANKTTEEVNLNALGIHLIKGSNTIQFKLADGKTYMTTLTYPGATEMPSSIKANLTSDGTYVVITYANNITQQVVINKYNSDITDSGTRIYFDSLDGNRYTTLLNGSEAPVDPSPSPSADPSTPTDKPQPDEYYMTGGLSFNIRNNKAAVTNPSNWNAKTITIKPTVSIYGKNYKVTKIAADSFYGMAKLKKITIGKNVTTIGARAMAYCKKLKTIIFNSGNVTSMGKNALKKIAKNATIYIRASKKKYKKLVKLIKKKGGIPKSTKFKRLT